MPGCGVILADFHAIANEKIEKDPYRTCHFNTNIS